MEVGGEILSNEVSLPSAFYFEGVDGSISHAWRWGDGFNHFHEPNASVNQNSCLDDLAYF